MDIVRETAYRLCEMMDIFSRLPEKVQHQSQSAAGADSRKGADGFHSVFE